VRASVGRADLKQYVKWNAQYGSFGEEALGGDGGGDGDDDGADGDSDGDGGGDDDGGGGNVKGGGGGGGGGVGGGVGGVVKAPNSSTVGQVNSALAAATALAARAPARG
jgi:hypothetical protein